MNFRASVVLFLLICFTFFLSLIVSDLFLPQLEYAREIGDPPEYLGRLNSIDLYLHLGDIAIPNRLVPLLDNPEKFEIDERIRYWDSYLITAPVPRIIDVDCEKQILIPWTILPSSVVLGIDQIDPEFSNMVENWLALKGSPAEWKFDRLSFFEVPSSFRYHQITGVATIHSVNLFEFVQELGNQYKENLASAISSATKEVIEQSGKIGRVRGMFT